MTNLVHTVGVVGAGQMGAGIAQVAAMAEFDVLLLDQDQPSLDRARQTITRSLAQLTKRGTTTAALCEAAVCRITQTTDPNDLLPCQLVIEAVPEELAIKQSIFATFDTLCQPNTILASNTSSISITLLAASTKRPHQCIGMHFMNPVPVMKLVEIIPGLPTDETTLATAQSVATRMEKQFTVAKDYPGFLANRILMPMLNEAFFALMENIGTAEDIDTTMKLGTHHPMGPLTLADFIGLDTCLATIETLHRELGDPKFRPCPLLRNYVAAGWLGRKSGRGVYEY